MGWIKITGDVVGAELQAQRIKDVSNVTVERLREAMNRGVDDVRARIATNIASMLDRKSGKMLRAVYGFTKETTPGEVFTNYAGVRKRAYYAKFQEVGVQQKDIEVKGYSFHSKAGDVRAGRKKVAMGVGFRGPYTRQMHVPAHHMVREAYSSLFDRILADIERSIRGSSAD